MGAGKSRRNDNRNQMMKPMVGSMPPNYMQAPPHGMAYAQPPQPQPTFMTAPQVQPLPPLPPPPQMGMYPIQQVGPMPPMYCHQPVMMHTPHQFTVMGDQKRSSLFPGPPQHSSGFHMGPNQMRPLMPGYASNTSEYRNSSAALDSSDNEDYKYYPSTPQMHHNHQIQKYRNL